MIPFLLFFATAVSTMLLTHFWGNHGAAPAGEQEIGYAGAVIILVAAYISAFSLWAGRCVAALGLIVAFIYCLCEDVGVAPRYLTLWSFLAMLMLAGTFVYVIGTFMVRGRPNALFPPHASRPFRMVVWLFVVVPAICFSWMAFWRNATEVQVKTVPANWEPVTLEQVTSGRHQMKFTAQQPPLSVIVASDELYDELQSAQKKSVDIKISETFKHGEMVAWSVDSIDGHTTEDFSLLNQQPQILGQ